jgi:hypothetical protein
MENLKISEGYENASFHLREFCSNVPILQINRKIHENNLVEILGPMVPPLGGFTWNVPGDKK